MTAPQALVEQCAAAGRVADVERCVLRLDLATLDFNQVLHPAWLASFLSSIPLFHSTSSSQLGQYPRSAQHWDTRHACTMFPMQVTSLCRTHQLHSALAFLFPCAWTRAQPVSQSG